ncbi:acyl-CoA-binding domain-containing protein 6 [Zeugodacus cucurbitae]|uniref:acyl-CoA-binding domain-containing protein 6 n=1 Tax=Zeugodacus cucurbitae TaxID=28588 RepID=UPI0023D93E27|nr:acyl-CoA-binding domain-containing protein 6 [Zeugodacus cucurbitae]
MSTSDFSDSDIDTEPIDEIFSEAAEHLQKIHNSIESTDLLEIYGLYKQATCGRCNTQKPSVFNMQSRSKWCAWNDLGDMSQTEAKHLYVAKVKKVDSNWVPNHEIGNKSKSSSGWVVHSIPQKQEESDQKAEHEKNAFDFIKEGNFIQLQKSLTVEIMQHLDENGMGLIHWATDRNAVEILKYLIDKGVDVNFRDSEQQTALHYAASCGHVDCIRLLLDANADPAIKDADGQSSLDVADNNDIFELLKT